MAFAVFQQDGLHFAIVLRPQVQRHIPFHVHAGRRQFADQKAFMLVLRQAQHERVGAQTLADLAQRQFHQLLAAFVDVHGIDLDAQADQLVGKAQLLVKLQGARMHGHGPRRLARTAVLVDDAAIDAMARQAQGKHEAGRTGADDQDGRCIHAIQYRTGWAMAARRLKLLAGNENVPPKRDMQVLPILHSAVIKCRARVR
ncbi:hypothetical protein D3C72_1547800 [compost metagenome]